MNQFRFGGTVHAKDNYGIWFIDFGDNSVVSASVLRDVCCFKLGTKLLS